MKQCSGCNLSKVIWKSVGKNTKYCKACWFKLNKPKAISPISKKRKNDTDEYLKKRDVFLNLNQHCQAKLLNCTLISTDVHHLYSGKDRNKYYLDETTWKAVCRNCHNYIHDKLSKEDAINLNLKLIE